MSVELYFSDTSESNLSEYCTSGFGFIRCSRAGDDELLKLLFLEALLSTEDTVEVNGVVGLLGRYLSLDDLATGISSFIFSLTFLEA